MTQERRQFGHKVEAEVVDIERTCNWGHKVGQKMEVSCHDTAGICGMLYHAMFPMLSVLQFGGSYPWGDEGTAAVECPDSYNLVKMTLKRVSD